MRILGEGRVRLQFEGMEAIKSDRNDPVARATLAIREAGGRPRPKLKTGTADFNVVGPIWQCPIAAYGRVTARSITRQRSGSRSRSTRGRSK